MLDNFSSLEIFLISIGSVLLICTIWWFVPKLQISFSANKLAGLAGRDLVSLEDEFRKTITQALGSVFVVASILFAYLQIADARQATEQQLKVARRNQDIQIMSSQFAKGFDLVGSNTTSLRIGGIQILDNWINHPLIDDGSTKEERYSLVAPALISLIRQATAFNRTVSRCEDFDRPQSARISDDVRAALRVIGPWTHQRDRGILLLDTLNLSGADLAGFNLDGAILSYTDLSGSNLRGATFRGSRLYCSNLWASDLSEANFSSSNEQTVLSGSLIMRVTAKNTNFSGANLRSANVSESAFDHVNFSDADLFNTNFSSSTLISPVITSNTDVSDACFVESELSNVNLQFAKGFGTSYVISPHEKSTNPSSHCFRTQSHGLLLPTAP